MKKNLLALLCCLLSAAYLFANEDDKGTITGKVTTSDGQPAASVSVVLKDARRSAVTNDDGYFIMRNVPVGSYRLEVSLVGYETATTEVIVKDKQATSVSLQLSLSNKQLQEVIVRKDGKGYITTQPSSSLRLAEPILEVPQNIQVVTGSMLNNQQVISMSDGLIRNVSGLVRAEHWGDLYTNIVARGTQIQAFRNGFNVVNSYWGPLTEDMSFVDHIEFVKGPAGFMLSSGDAGGLYNVVTKKPTGQTKGEASMTVGSYGLFRTTLDLDGKLNKSGSLLYRLNLAAQEKQTHRENEYNNRYVVAPVISYQVDDKTKLTLEYNYQYANMSNVGSYYMFAPEGFATLPVDFTVLPAGTPGTKINDHSFYVNLQHDLNENWKLTGQLSKFIYKQEGYSMWPSAINADGSMIRNIGLWDAASTMNMGQVFVNGNIATGHVYHRILAGVDAANKEYLADWNQSFDLDTLGGEFNPKDPERVLAPDNGYPVFDRSKSLEERAYASGAFQTQSYTSFYLQDELGFFDNKIRLTLAGRYTKLKQAYYGSVGADRFTPRVGISVSIDRETSVYGLYDQAFMPQAGKLTNGKKVQPITGNNMEIGIKKNWFGGSWSTSLALYRILKNNELTADPNADPNDGLSIELGQKTAKGIEFDLKGTIVKGLDLIANYAYTDSRVTKLAQAIKDDPASLIHEGDIVPGYSKHTANTWLTYKLQNGTLKGLGISGGFTWLIDRATYWEASPDPNKEMKDYFKLDGGLFWENDKIRITANVFNILNTYLYSGSYYSDYFGVPVYSWQTEPLRNVRLSISYSF